MSDPVRFLVDLTGRVLFDGIDVLDRQVDVLDIRKRMSLIAQTPNRLPMSIYDNVAYGPRIHGTNNRKELDQIVERCLQVASLWNEVKNRLTEPASKLSPRTKPTLAKALIISSPDRTRLSLLVFFLSSSTGMFLGGRCWRHHAEPSAFAVQQPCSVFKELSSRE